MATTVSNILQAPTRTRSRKDLSSLGSNPTLMALDEEDGNHSPPRMLDVNKDDNAAAVRKYSDSNLPSPTYSDKNGSGKRRSSFAAILGRRNSKVCTLIIISSFRPSMSSPSFLRLSCNNSNLFIDSQKKHRHRQSKRKKSIKRHQNQIQKMIHLCRQQI